MSPYKIVVVEKVMKDAMDNLLKGGPLFIAILIIVVICVYNIIKIVLFYQRMANEHKSSLNLHLLKLKGPNLGTNDMKKAEFDNYEDPTKNVVLDDEYNRMTQTIQKSLSEYKEYNSKLNSFYQATKQVDAPDQIDISVLKKENDEYI